MAKLVTRTVSQTTGECIYLNTQTGETTVSTYTIQGRLSDKGKILKTLEKLAGSDCIMKPIFVSTYAHIDALLGITVEEFMEIAKPVERKTKTNKEDK